MLNRVRLAGRPAALWLFQAVVVILVVGGTAWAQAGRDQLTPNELLDQYCVSCHNDQLETGGFSLEPLDVTNVAEHPEAWEKVVRKLRAGAMPPRPRPRAARSPCPAAGCLRPASPPISASG